MKNKPTDLIETITGGRPEAKEALKAFLEQGAAKAARELAMDSSHIPIITAAILGGFSSPQS